MSASQYAFGNLSGANTRALDTVDHQYGQNHASEALLVQAANELVQHLNDLPLGGTVSLTKGEFEQTFHGNDADQRAAVIALSEQCGCRVMFRAHPQTCVVITRKQRRSELNVSLRVRT